MKCQENVESVQFMQFDCEGNLYVYPPGAGCSGIPRKIPQGFSQEDLSGDNLNVSQHSAEVVGKDYGGINMLKPANLHRIVPQVGVSSDLLRRRFVFSVLI